MKTIQGGIVWKKYLLEMVLTDPIFFILMNSEKMLKKVMAQNLDFGTFFKRCKKECMISGPNSFNFQTS